MQRSNVLGADIKKVEQLLAMKKAEYVNAIKRGQVFNDLKKIFLEVKELEHRLQDVDNHPIDTAMRTAS